MRVFITGATGFVGSYLVKRLLSEGHDILCLTRNIDKISFPTYNNVEFLEGDITKPDTYSNYLVNIDMIYHLAGYVKHEAYNKNEAYKNNVIGTRNIFNLALEKKIKKVIYLSSAGIFHSKDNSVMDENSLPVGKFINYYAYSKYLSYIELKDFLNRGLDVVTIMPVSIYGKGSPLFINFFDFLIKYKIFFKKILDKKLSLVYIDDVVEAIVKVSRPDYHRECYLLSGSVIEINDIISIVNRIFKINIKILNIPLWLMYVFVNFLDPLSKLTRKKFFINKEILNFMVGDISVSSKKAKNELSWIPSSFGETFSDMLVWYKDSLNSK